MTFSPGPSRPAVLGLAGESGGSDCVLLSSGALAKAAHWPGLGLEAAVNLFSHPQHEAVWSRETSRAVVTSGVTRGESL